MKVVQNPQLSFHELEDECLLHDEKAGKVHVLNHSARFVWSRCSVAIEKDELARLLSAEYQVDAETALVDTNAIVTSFLERSILIKAN